MKVPKFRSGLEKKIYEDAETRGHTMDYEPSEPVVRYVVPSRYIPDFKLGNGILIEAKGWLRPRDRGKMLRVKKENPDLDIRFVLQRANSKIGKAPSSLMYWQWCEKHDFLWAEGHIPEDWFHEKRSTEDT